MKHKIVIKVSMNAKKSRLNRFRNGENSPSKAMGIVVEQPDQVRLLVAYETKPHGSAVFNGFPITSDFLSRKPPWFTLARVESVALKGEDKDQLVVIGDNIDPVAMIILLRKSMGYAELLSVGPHPEEKKKEKKEGKKEPVIQPINWPVINQGVPPFYVYEASRYNQEQCCTVM